MGVQLPREENYRCAFADRRRFEAYVLADLERLPHRIIRLHDSGDFFDQEYFDAWCRIAHRFQGEKIFYGYTKSLDLKIWDRLPENMILVQSETGKFDHMIDRTRQVERVFETAEDRDTMGYVDASDDDLPVLLGMQKIGHVYHGVKSKCPAKGEGRRLALAAIPVSSGG